MEYGSNPCFEVNLRPYSFCNLVEINDSTVESQEDFNNRAKVASFISTLQASYTDFHYLRDIWKRNTEKDSLIGVSRTGIASNKTLKLDDEKAAEIVNLENIRLSSILGIKPAARTTVVKPAGTTSLVLGTSSGIHAWHSKYYIRRLRIGKDESIYKYLKTVLPELIVDDYFRPHDTAILEMPQKAPDNAITRKESAISLLNRVKNISSNWIAPGSKTGPNNNNVSTTVAVKEKEWDKVIDWLWVNRNTYNGITVLPYDGGTYVQAPFEECSKEKYEELEKYVHKIDLTKVLELEDNTTLTEELACSGGNCEIK